jgi:hypothetical protein
MTQLTTVTCSFSYKHNAGNYESKDFFCSRSQECTVEEADAVSWQLFRWCRSQVFTDLNEYLRQAKEQAARKG